MPARNETRQPFRPARYEKDNAVTAKRKKRAPDGGAGTNPGPSLTVMGQGSRSGPDHPIRGGICQVFCHLSSTLDSG
jgi:hypothetical protein